MSMPTAKKPARCPTDGVREIALELPMLSEPDRYTTRHLDIQLRQAQAIALRMLFNGCQERRARLADGKYINTTADAVRFLLERIGAAHERAGANPDAK